MNKYESLTLGNYWYTRPGVFYKKCPIKVVIKDKVRWVKFFENSPHLTRLEDCPEDCIITKRRTKKLLPLFGSVLPTKGKDKKNKIINRGVLCN